MPNDFRHTARLVVMPAEAEGAAALVAFLRDAGLVGVAVLFVAGLITRKIVLGWQYDEEKARADRERQRADRAESLLERITMTADRSTNVTEQMVRRRVPAEALPPGTEVEVIP